MTRAILLLLAVTLPVLCRAQKDTTVYVDRYEIIKVMYRRPLLRQEYPARDTVYNVLLREPIRVQIKGGTLTAGALGTYTVVGYDARVQKGGSNGDDVWHTWKLKGGNRAIIYGHYFMLSEKRGKVQRNYTCDIIHRPGT